MVVLCVMTTFKTCKGKHSASELCKHLGLCATPPPPLYYFHYSTYSPNEILGLQVIPESTTILTELAHTQQFTVGRADLGCTASKEGPGQHQLGLLPQKETARCSNAIQHACSRVRQEWA